MLRTWLSALADKKARWGQGFTPSEEKAMPERSGGIALPRADTALGERAGAIGREVEQFQKTCELWERVFWICGTESRSACPNDLAYRQTTTKRERTK